MNVKTVKKIAIATKAVHTATRTRTFAELKEEIDNDLEQEMLVAAAEYKEQRRQELGIPA